MLQFIKCSRNEEDIERLTEGNERFSRMNPETAELINLITDSKLKLNVEEGTVNMCQAIQQMREHSKAAGIVEGKAEGKVEGRMEAYAEMVAAGMIDVQFAARKFNVTAEEFIRKTGITIPIN